MQSNLQKAQIVTSNARDMQDFSLQGESKAVNKREVSRGSAGVHLVILICTIRFLGQSLPPSEGQLSQSSLQRAH